MKRFWKTVDIEQAEGGWRVTLDGRPLRTQGGAAQLVPTRELATLLATEWAAQGEKVDPKLFIHRDLADFAIDRIAPDREQAIASIMPYAETDTLCYRADPDEPLFARQQELWEPLLTETEARLDARFTRISGIVHRPQPPETLARLHDELAALDPFILAGVTTLASLAASLVIALAALHPDADHEALYAAANCEEDWQAELWGLDAEAQKARAAKLEAFAHAVKFIRTAQAGR